MLLICLDEKKTLTIERAAEYPPGHIRILLQEIINSLPEK